MTSASQLRSASAQACWIPDSMPPAAIRRWPAGRASFLQRPREVREKHLPILEVVTGRKEYRGGDPGFAAISYQIGMVMFWTSILSYWQAIALARANGLTGADILPRATGTVNSLPGLLVFYPKRIDRGEHSGDVDRLPMGWPPSACPAQQTLMRASARSSRQRSVTSSNAEWMPAAGATAPPPLSG